MTCENTGNCQFTTLLTVFHLHRGGGGTRILSYIRRRWSFFGVQNFLGFFRKINIFFGMKNLWINLGGHHKIGLYLCGHFYAF